VKKVSRYAWIKIAKIAEEKNFLESVLLIQAHCVDVNLGRKKHTHTHTHDSSAI
jgi:hypothetical protein